jgi:hypothetical protein
LFLVDFEELQRALESFNHCRNPKECIFTKCSYSQLVVNDFPAPMHVLCNIGQIEIYKDIILHVKKSKMFENLKTLSFLRPQSLAIQKYVLFNINEIVLNINL